MFLGVGIDARVPCIRNESETETDDKVAMPYLQAYLARLSFGK